MEHTEHHTEKEESAHAYNETCCERYSSCRWTIGYLCCAARLSQSALRQMIGMAVVCMTFDDIHIHNPEVTFGTPEDNTTVVSDTKKAEFVWSSEFEGLVLSSFTFGFIATPVLGGYMAARFGGKRVITVALTIGSILTITTPVATRIHQSFLVVFRAIVGIFMGTVDPAIQSLWSRWAPREEKASLTSCSYAGVSIGGMVTFFISGYLGNLELDKGWPLIFYVFGGFALLCVIPWVILVSDSPTNHPHISEREVKIITREQTTSQSDLRPQAIPWRHIMTSPAFLAIVVAHVSYSWVASWAMAYLPKYLNQVLQYSIEEDGVLSSLPYAGRLLAGIMCGALSDLILKRQYLSTANTRKLFQVIGCLGCALCTIPIGYMAHESRTLAVCLLVTSLSLQNCTSVSFRINHLDIAPRHAGVLMGVTTTCAMVASLSAPLLTSTLVKQGTREEWQIVFWVVVGFNLFGAAIFVIFAKGEEQEWASEESTTVIATNDGQTDN